MTKITLSTVSELQAFPSAAANINSNSDILEVAIDNTLSRDGTSPNAMGAALDMNSNRIVNLPAPISSLEPVRVLDLTGGSAVTVNNLPTGGTVRQVLAKNSGSNYDVVWNSSGVPNGGTNNQVLKKNSGTDYDTGWTTLTNVSSIAGNTGAFTLSNGITNSVNDIRLTVGQLPGEPSTGSATAGNIGEFLSATGSSLALTSTVPINVASIVLTAGDWDVTGMAQFAGAGSTSVTNTGTSLSLTSGTTNTAVGSYSNDRVPASVDFQCTHSICPVRMSVSVNTTVYLVSFAIFSVSTYAVSGIIRARRVR